MNSVSAQVGIDVCKDHLDVSIDGCKPLRVANSVEGCGELVNRLPAGSVIHLESTGGYERIPRRLLAEAGFLVKVHDPFKVRRMAQARARRGKTDALDAKHLAQAGPDLLAQQEKSPDREKLCDLSRAIDQLKATAASMRVRAAMPGLDTFVKASFLEVATNLSAQVRSMEKEFVRRVKLSPLKAKYELALTVPGVGPCLARVAVCELPEDLCAFTVAQLTSYAGVAPIDDESGKSRKPARIRRGNARLKAALYMPALSCISLQPWAKDLYARLRARGRAHQQAAIAVMRRLLMRILQVLQRGSAWKAEPTP